MTPKQFPPFFYDTGKVVTFSDSVDTLCELGIIEDIGNPSGKITPLLVVVETILGHEMQELFELVKVVGSMADEPGRTCKMKCVLRGQGP